MKHLIAILLILVGGSLFGQFSPEEKFQLDSLNAITHNKAKHDTIKVLTYLKLVSYFYQNNPDSAISICQKGKMISEQINYLNGKSECYGWLGYLILKKGDIPNALTYFHKALKTKESMGDKKGIASSLHNIGYIYNSQGDIEKALEYFQKSLVIEQEIGDKKGVAESLNNIGAYYVKKKDLKLALENYNKSLKIKEEIGDKKGIAISINNIAGIFKQQGLYTEALQYLYRSLKINQELNNKEGVSSSLNNIGYIEFKIGKLLSAEKNLSDGLKLALEIGSPRWISDNSKNLSRLFKQQGKYEEALEMYELHIQMRDSIKNEETQKATIRQQTKYEFEKAQLVKEQEEKEAARIRAGETERRNNLQYSLIFLGILLFFGVVLSLGFIKVSPTIAEGIIFFAFLLLFEFLLVLSDPYVDGLTNGEPMYKLLANALLAGFIFPAHAFFERILKVRLIKNKKNA